ncbi:MAG TPA: sugar phosphate isomerase/epimerase [Blastocatellia bacterium]|nr:sugar phosphate isomerase/epimerase [Blastocatellia bacterium]
MRQRLTRRDFGKSVIAGAAGLSLNRAIQGKPADKLKPSVFGGIQVGVQSYTFRTFSVDKMIEAMVSIGLSSVELWDGHLNPMKASEADFKATKRKFDDAGIKVNAYCVNFPVTATDEHLDRGFNGALLLGTNVMTASVRKSIVPKLDQWCQKYKIKLGLHNHWFGDKWFKGDRKLEFETPEDFANALKSASKYLSINLDIGHFFAAGYDPVAYIREHHDRIVSLHIKDRDKDAEHTQHKFGEGATPIVETMKLIMKLKFPYAANIEYEPEPENPTPAVREAFEYLKRALS